MLTVSFPGYLMFSFEDSAVRTSTITGTNLLKKTKDPKILLEVRVSFRKLNVLQCIQRQLSLHCEYRATKVEESQSTVNHIHLKVRRSTVGEGVPATS